MKTLLARQLTPLPGIVIPASSVRLADRVAQGQYDFVNTDDFSETTFPLTVPSGPRELYIAQFGESVTADDVAGWADANGFELALIDDLLAVGSNLQFREWREKYVIVAPGSPANLDDGQRYVPFLIKGSSGRDLQAWGRSNFDDFVLFLVVRRPGPADFGSVTAPSFGLSAESTRSAVPSTDARMPATPQPASEQAQLSMPPAECEPGVRSVQTDIFMQHL